MKKFIIGAAVTVAAVAVYAVKKINDDRKTIELYSQDEAVLVRKETFKDAAKRKVNEILKYVADNADKISGFVSIVSTISTVIAVVTAGLELYSTIKKAVDKPEDKLFNEVEAIRLRLDSFAAPAVEEVI